MSKIVTAFGAAMNAGNSQRPPLGHDEAMPVYPETSAEYWRERCKTLEGRIADQVALNVRLKSDMGNLRTLAEARRVGLQEVRRELELHRLALKGIDTHLNSLRLSSRADTGKPRLPHVKTLEDPHERILDANNQEVYPDGGQQPGPEDR